MINLTNWAALSIVWIAFDATEIRRIKQALPVQGESKKSDDCDMYNRNVIPCGV
jgi:hypothetical protein